MIPILRPDYEEGCVADDDNVLVAFRHDHTCCPVGLLSLQLSIPFCMNTSAIYIGTSLWSQCACKAATHQRRTWPLLHSAKEEIFNNPFICKMNTVRFTESCSAVRLQCCGIFHTPTRQSEQTSFESNAVCANLIGRPKTKKERMDDNDDYHDDPMSAWFARPRTQRA